MSADLEDTLTTALRAKASDVPASPMPRLGTGQVTAAPARRRWLVPVAAAVVAVVGIGGAALALAPGDSSAPTPITAAAGPDGLKPGEVYYSLSLTSTGTNGVIVETQLWQPQDRTGAWQQKAVGGRSIEDGRVVPSEDRVEAPAGGECYPATKPSDASCTEPGAWFNPTLEFLANASHDPAVIKQQLWTEAVAEEKERTGPGGDFAPSAGTLSDENLTYLELNHLRGVLDGNGQPAELSAALKQVVASMSGIQVKENTANLVGERGTGYSLPNHEGELLTVVFDGEGAYLGSPTSAVSHGVAPGLGEAPSRMLD
ncbi:MAG: hypothetical protein GEV28_20410 [Actinophytocola sp.]|uniref:hypothetical protein n=1 Tax=Actinophytocola sp. TaxID=1872138 RepID=UPI0013270BCB|nr:hypothetical protein [Actinophytocola sp.]MPZ82629.1 hypothetical protein [Actinophytocola sp.]